MTVAQLKGARDRVRRRDGKCEGRKSYAERNPALVAAAKALRAKRPYASLLKLSAALAENGYTTPRGLPYSASAVKSMRAADAAPGRGPPQSIPSAIKAVWPRMVVSIA
jgi:hypothetical protein